MGWCTTNPGVSNPENMVFFLNLKIKLFFSIRNLEPLDFLHLAVILYWILLDFYVTGVVLLLFIYLKGKWNFHSTSRETEYINNRWGLSEAGELTQIRVGSVFDSNFDHLLFQTWISSHVLFGSHRTHAFTVLLLDSWVHFTTVWWQLTSSVILHRQSTSGHSANP